MRILIDTQIFIWAVIDSENLSAQGGGNRGRSKHSNLFIKKQMGVLGNALGIDTAGSIHQGFRQD